MSSGRENELPRSSPYRSTPDAPVTETERDQLSSRLNAAYTAGTLDPDDYRRGWTACSPPSGWVSWCRWSRGCPRCRPTPTRRSWPVRPGRARCPRRGVRTGSPWSRSGEWRLVMLIAILLVVLLCARRHRRHPGGLAAPSPTPRRRSPACGVVRPGRGDRGGGRLRRDLDPAADQPISATPPRVHHRPPSGDGGPHAHRPRGRATTAPRRHAPPRPSEPPLRPRGRTPARTVSPRPTPRPSATRTQRTPPTQPRQSPGPQPAVRPADRLLDLWSAAAAAAQRPAERRALPEPDDAVPVGDLSGARSRRRGTG